jgi:hypothetical protein
MMYDLSLVLEDLPGALAEMGEALGKAGVSVEGGGAWVVEQRGTAHFLVVDGAGAQRALAVAGLTVLAARPVIVLKLKQDEAGQLGKICRRMAQAGVNIETLYSDHQNQLILVVDDFPKAELVAQQWMMERDGAVDPRAAKADSQASSR